MGSGFVGLHIHSDHSILDGRGNVEEIAARALHNGDEAVAVTDHDEVGGHIRFQTACLKAGIKPVFGTEARWVHDIKASREAKTAGHDDSHVVLLAENQQGLKNMWALSSLAYEPENFYNKPQLNPGLMKQYSAGLWASDGCGLTRFAGHVEKDREDLARQEWGVLLDVFGDRFYSELHTWQFLNPSTDEQKALNAKITKMNQAKVRLGQELGVPLVVVNDAHYASKKQWEEHRAVWDMSTGGWKKDKTEEKGETAAWMMNPDEIRHYMGLHGVAQSVITEAMDNSTVIAEYCNAEIKGPLLSMPRLYESDAEDSHRFRLAIEAGFTRFVLDKGLPEQLYRERLEYEARLIIDMGMTGYFNVVADYVLAARDGSYARWLTKGAKKTPCLCGPGRGCLTKDARVWTPEGYVGIADVKVGQLVRSHTGELREVVETYRYEVDETTYHIRAYGDASGVQMTGDHRVLVSPARRETSRMLLTRGYRFLAGASPVEWRRADEIREGDLVCTPIPPSSGAAPVRIDVGSLVKDSQGILITESEIVETVQTNIDVPHSIRKVSRATGVSQNALRNIVSDGPRGPRTFAVRQRVGKYLSVQGFESLDHWADHVKAQATYEVRTPRYIVIDDNFLFLVGAWASNGWLRASSDREVGFAERASTRTDKIALLVKQVWGIDVHSSLHRTKDVVQYLANSHALWALFSSLCPRYEYQAQTKSLPEWASHLNKAGKRAVLDGLWWGDGSTVSKWSYSTSSRRLMEQVRDLLWALGAPASVAEDSRIDSRPEWANKTLAWRITTTKNFGDQKNQNGFSDDRYVYHRVRKIDTFDHTKEVFDVQVAVDHSFMTDSFVVHNSGGGSLVNYLMGITSIDPIRYDLMFERFINPDRPDFPDIDVDFQKTHRKGVIGYLGKRYGEGNVVSLGTRGHSRPRQMLADLCRAEKIGYGEMRKIVGIVEQVDQIPEYDEGAETPDDQEPPAWAEVLQELGGDLAPWAKKYPGLFDKMENMVGMVRGVGVHPAGVVVNTSPILGAIPTRRKGGRATEPKATQFDMYEIESLGGVKDDLLSNRGLDVLAIARQSVYERHGVWLDYDGFGFGIPEGCDPDKVVVFGDEHYNDPAIYEMVDRGQTAGLFQIHTGGGTKLAIRFKPRGLVDVADLASINRPGVTRVPGLLDKYIERRHGRQEVTYDHPLMEKITGPSGSMNTYGILVYQEQMMRTARLLAGFTPGESERLRKGIGKKIAAIIDELEPKFIDGCTANEEFIGQGGTRKIATIIWQSLKAAGNYSFNRCAAGSTLVKLSGSNRHSNGTMTVEDMWRRLNDSARLEGRACWYGCPHTGYRGQCLTCRVWRQKFRDERRGLRAWSLGSDGRLHPNRIVDVHQNGVQCLWRVTLSDGKSISATSNHRHMTPLGWREVRDLSIGDELLVCGEYEGQTWEPDITRTTAADPSYVGARLPNSERNGVHSLGYRDGGYLALREWTETQEWKCSRWGCERSREAGDRIERAHLDGNRLNNASTNLAMLCASHHKEHDYRINGRRVRGEKGYPAIPTAIVSIESAGEEMTYDVEMADPYHSWVANDIVTHNSHAIGYAMQVCWETWTKHYYYDEFISACLAVHTDKTVRFLRECRQRKRPILPPDVNHSGNGFTLTDEGIRYGITDIAGVGKGAVPEILTKRPFVSLADYLNRTTSRGGRKKGVVDSLIRLGGFDWTGRDRQDLLDEVYRFRREQEAPVLWAKMDEDERLVEMERVYLKEPEEYPRWDFSDPKVIYDTEIELLGTFVTTDPMDKYANKINNVCIRHPMDYNDYEVGDSFTVGGQLIKINLHEQKDGKTMAFLTIRWNEEDFSICAFAKAWERVGGLFREGVAVACDVIKLQGGGASLSTVQRLEELV